MGSVKPPPDATFIDRGGVPTYRVDGLDSYEISDGWTFSRFFVEEPEPTGSPHTLGRRKVRRICLAVICRQQVQREIHQQVEEITTEQAAMKRVS